MHVRQTELWGSKDQPEAELCKTKKLQTKSARDNVVFTKQVAAVEIFPFHAIFMLISHCDKSINSIEIYQVVSK